MSSNSKPKDSQRSTDFGLNSDAFYFKFPFWSCCTEQSRKKVTSSTAGSGPPKEPSAISTGRGHQNFLAVHRRYDRHEDIDMGDVASLSLAAQPLGQCLESLVLVIVYDKKCIEMYQPKHGKTYMHHHPTFEGLLLLFNKVAASPLFSPPTALPRFNTKASFMEICTSLAFAGALEANFSNGWGMIWPLLRKEEDLGPSSGGFIANVAVKGSVQLGTQQQFLFRNCRWTAVVAKFAKGFFSRINPTAQVNWAKWNSATAPTTTPCMSGSRVPQGHPKSMHRRWFPTSQQVTALQKSPFWWKKMGSGLST